MTARAEPPAEPPAAPPATGAAGGGAADRGTAGNVAGTADGRAAGNGAATGNGTAEGRAAGNGAATGNGKRLPAPHRREATGPRLREKIVVRGYRAGSWVLGRLPFGPTVLIGGWIAEVVYRAWPDRRAHVRANAAHVLGLPPEDPRVGRLARSIFRNQVRWIVEVMRYARQSREEHAAGFDGTLEERLHEAWLDSKGLILVGLHIGNGEAVAAALAGHGWPVSVLADDTAYEELFEDFAALRRTWGVEVIRWRNLREVYRVLRRGEILGLLVDWGYRPDGQPVRFLGAWTTFPTGPAVLAGRTGATIVPFWTMRRPDGMFTAEIGARITVASAEPAEVARATQAIAHELEAGVRAVPDQWCVFKPMWPGDPADAAGLEARAVALAGPVDGSPVTPASVPTTTAALGTG